MLDQVEIGLNFTGKIVFVLDFILKDELCMVKYVFITQNCNAVDVEKINNNKSP